jgi:hypothetical protein
MPVQCYIPAKDYYIATNMDELPIYSLHERISLAGYGARHKPVHDSIFMKNKTRGNESLVIESSGPLAEVLTGRSQAGAVSVLEMIPILT